MTSSFDSSDRKLTRRLLGSAIALSPDDPPWLAHRKIVLAQTTKPVRRRLPHNLETQPLGMTGVAR